MPEAEQHTFRRTLILFLFGALAHYLMLELYVHFAYRNGGSTAFVNDPRTIAAISCLGGVMLASIMNLLFGKPEQSGNTQKSRAVLRAGLLSIFSTFCALEVFYVLASIWLSVVGTVGRGVSSSAAGLLIFIEIQTYGMEPIIRSIPFAFIVGVLAQEILIKTNQIPNSSLPENSRSLTKLSWTCGVISFLSLAILTINICFAIAAIMLGIIALKRRAGPVGGSRIAAATSIGFAALTISLTIVLRLIQYRQA